MERQQKAYKGVIDYFKKKIMDGELRPGEKLYEELLMDEEGLQNTDNELIHIGKPIEMDESLFFRQLRNLEVASRDESNDIKGLIKEIVPTYNPKGEQE